MIFWLKVIGGLIAFAAGIWFGMPGRYVQTAADIEQRMSSPSGRRRKVKRHFTPFAWLQRQISAKSTRTDSRRRGFRMETPEDH